MDNKKSYIVIEGKQVELPQELIDKIKIKIESVKTTYETIVSKLSNKAYYTDAFGNVASTKEQLGNLMELNKLINTAKYLNDGWVPNFNVAAAKWYVYLSGNPQRAFQEPLELKFANHTVCDEGGVYFKSKELLEQAVEILGEESIRKALTRY